MKWCKKAQELGTLPDEAASWMRQHGRQCSECGTQAGHRRQRLPRLARHAPTRRRRARRPGDGAPNANTIGIDDLNVTRFLGDIWDDDVLREAMAGCDVVYYCVVDTRGWLRDPAPLFRTNVEGTRNVLETSPKCCGPARGSSSPAATSPSAGGAAVAPPRTTSSDDRGLTPYVRSRVQAENLVMRVRARARAARGRDVRVDDLRQRRLGPHPARRDHRRRGVRQAAVRDERHRTGGRRCRRRRARDDPGGRARAASASAT